VYVNSHWTSPCRDNCIEFIIVAQTKREFKRKMFRKITSHLALSSLLLVAVLSFSVNSNIAVPNFLDEKYRPQLHFSVAENWLNDPNGLVYYDGEYHLYYQYTPDQTTPGPKYWAHSLSTDLVHWEDLPVAISPDALGDIWSGSAVVDFQNSSGFQTDQEISVIVAVFTQTSDFQKQSIAYSNDKGRTFTMFSGNPVVPNTGMLIREMYI